jgi:hypothetical protein
MLVHESITKAKHHYNDLGIIAHNCSRLILALLAALPHDSLLKSSAAFLIKLQIEKKNFEVFQLT